MTALLALVLAFAPLHQPPGCVIKRDSRGRIARSRVAVHRFMKLHPCPGGPDKGNRKRCRGYVVDHVVALNCCGPDAPCNMQWESIAEAHAKDRWELDCAEAAKKVRNSCPR